MKFLIHSDAPTVRTGYGVQTALLARRLKAAGHEVAVSCTAGHEFEVGQWEGILVYPRGNDRGSADMICANAQHFFKGDRKAGWIITLTDVFVLKNPLLREWQVAAWCPIDHTPPPPSVRDFFALTGARPIAMSRWGEEQLRAVGLDPLYVPLAVDPEVFHPTPDIRGMSGRKLMGVDDDQFVVMMNFMNKALAFYDRKGVGAAFSAFGRFAANHPDAVLYVNSETDDGLGATYDLEELRIAATIPDHQIVFVDQFAYRSLGITGEMLAAEYTAADVFLAPSMGEGFCVPMLEAQACGTPVIVTDFSAQSELIGAGWAVAAQPFYNIHQGAWVVTPLVDHILVRLEQAYEARQDPAEYAELQESAVAFAAQYEADRVFSELWLPVLDELDAKPAPLELDRSDPSFDVEVIVPVLNRPQNVKPLVDSFLAARTTYPATLTFVVQEDDADEIAAIEAEMHRGVQTLVVPPDCTTFAQKVNAAAEAANGEADPEPWIFLAGDDVDFQPGWLEAAAKLAGEFDVIGTNDGGLNKLVAAGEHADHFFIRRAYIDRYGASLGGPGEVCHEGYRHFFVDREIVELAKARNVFTPCLESVVVHNRIRTPDTTDELAAAHFEEDGKRWQRRKVLMVAKAAA